MVGVPLLVGLVVTLAVMGPLIGLLRRWQVLDVPNARSSHAVAVPRGGGLAVIAGLYVGALTSRLSSASDWRGAAQVTATIALAVALLSALGLADDMRHLAAGVRLALQIVVVVAASVSITATEATSWALAAFLACVVWVVGYVNAFNFMDGINGISAMTAIVSAAWYAILATDAHDVPVAAFAAALAGASLAFLPWNLPRAKVFLGDVGSYGIGAALAFLGVLTAFRDENLWWGAAPALIYVADTVYTLLRRAARHEPLLEAHREHVYQRLVAGGLSHTATAGVVGGCTLLVLVLARLLPMALAIPTGLVVTAGYLALPGLLLRSPREAI